MRKIHLKQRVVEYLIFVAVAYSLYAIALTPLFYFHIGLTLEQIQAWLWQGFLIDLVLAYPTAKIIFYLKEKARIKWFNE